MRGGWRPRKKKTLADRRRTVLRAAKTKAQTATGLGGQPKKRDKPKPITLPTLKCLEEQ